MMMSAEKHFVGIFFFVWAFTSLAFRKGEVGKKILHFLLLSKI
jgi:hypothetical protein